MKPLRVSTRTLLACIGALLFYSQSHGQSVTPYYASDTIITRILSHYERQLYAWQTTQHHLSTQLQNYCQNGTAFNDVQQAWKESVATWTTFTTVAIEPMLQDRWVRTVDFTPTRPKLIEQSIPQVRELKDLAQIGTPAKGYPALEWILWQQPSSTCTYGLMLSQELDSLSQQYQESWKSNTVDHSRTYYTWLNQWLAGAQKLQWIEMQKPLKIATGNRKPLFSRPYSQYSISAWKSQWDTLKEFAVGTQADFPISIEYILRSRGHLTLAQDWHDQVQQTHLIFQSIFHTSASEQDIDRALLEKANLSLKQLIQFFERKVAIALQIPMEFSGADGD